jgi:hypothetical protein
MIEGEQGEPSEDQFGQTNHLNIFPDVCQRAVRNRHSVEIAQLQ